MYNVSKKLTTNSKLIRGILNTYCRSNFKDLTTKKILSAIKDDVNNN